MIKKILFLTVITLFTLTFVGAAAMPVFEEPVVVTTCGQSPGALMVKMIAQQVGIKAEQKDLLTAEGLKGNNYKTLIVTMGTSGKGMGAAGTNMKQEAKRIDNLIETAKENGLQVLGAHIEGMSRRADENDAQSIEIVMPQSDALIIKDSSNQDDFFSKKSEELNIPAIFFDKNNEMGKAFQELFDIK
ncbi:DUF6305 family protein [Halanaerobium praevalens]|uniref:DUF6305 domain-containing protein n=1 Tax=Halanaerobium praevalens (strain ATCC 33744 / DSM 2228 / GSL) TaxID=572479 RepID=E3DNZ3_HALPG|nr:DUF6305 family protein [Halanaerobium praevalens]ADO76617.1 hypothetical protein Hprae_0463 [Halanaerobium praevalens DSM 2228]